jgi:protein associated with RNAse G/E
MPPVLTDGTLDYIDLDIDVVVWPGREPVVLDMDEFRLNSRVFAYPREVVTNALRSLDELLQSINAREFPFDVYI